MSHRRLFVGVSLTTLATLMLELTLTRLFSATMFYHFAFMAISLALFGSGASGVFIYVWRRLLARGTTAAQMTVFSSLFSLGSVLSLLVILNNPLTLNVGDNYYRLAYVYAATAVPFFFSGCAVALAVSRYAHEITRLYLFDLLGAAVGCMLLIPFLNTFGAIDTVLSVAVISSLATLTFATSAGRRYTVGAGVLSAALGVLLAFNSTHHAIDIHRGPSKLLFETWNSFSRITVSGDLASGVAMIQIDRDAATHIARGSSYRSTPQRLFPISAVAYVLKRHADALIVGPGGGCDVADALAAGMRHITAVEVNSIIARDIMGSEPFRSYSGNIYGQPEVTLVVDEGRSFLRGSSAKYDIIQATMVDTWAATAAGAFALTENNLYTVEAFKDYANHLTDDGILTLTRWYFEPPDQLVRLVAITRQMMDELGIGNAPRHVMMVRDASTRAERTPATFLFKKSEFTPPEIRAVETLASRAGLQLLYTPATRPDGIFTRLLEAPDPSKIWDSLDGNVYPTRDNSPFFFNSIRLSKLGTIFHGAEEWQKTNLGTVILFALLAITSAMVCVFILGPLLLSGTAAATSTSNRLACLLYFACLGAGYVIIEVAMIAKFILFLGHPVFSLTVILFSLLTFSGLGSRCSGRFEDRFLAPTLVQAIGLLVTVVVLYVISLAPLFYALVQLPRLCRILITVGLMAPLAFLMGMPMPSGIRMLRMHQPEIIPWAWGINGAASVTGSVGALVIALLWGFNQALLVGALFYAVAAAVAWIAFADTTRFKPAAKTAIHE